MDDPFGDYGNVGPLSDGTYNVPTSALPSNQPWDTGGGSLGSYSNDVFGILRDGIGAWSQNQRNNQFLDYQRYEATQGGIYRQGVPNGVPVTVAARATMSPTMMLMIGAAVFLLLRK
ncbi:MAG: hypothetical protein ACJ8LG_21630 [Massilia sp.]